jgi:hypothetical protein
MPVVTECACPETQRSYCILSMMFRIVACRRTTLSIFGSFGVVLRSRLSYAVCTSRPRPSSSKYTGRKPFRGVWPRGGTHLVSLRRCCKRGGEDAISSAQAVCRPIPALYRASALSRHCLWSTTAFGYPFFSATFASPLPYGSCIALPLTSLNSGTHFLMYSPLSSNFSLWRSGLNILKYGCGSTPTDAEKPQPPELEAKSPSMRCSMK